MLWTTSHDVSHQPLLMKWQKLLEAYLTPYLRSRGFWFTRDPSTHSPQLNSPTNISHMQMRTRATIWPALKVQPGARMWTPVMLLHHGILLSAWLSLTHRCYDPTNSAGFWDLMPHNTIWLKDSVFWIHKEPSPSHHTHQTVQTWSVIMGYFSRHRCQTNS